ncbi:hypothetical protein GRF29_19g176455 [Pseudopithomyces chartarum]|uniref:Uncharacterized protein n=1 Tax=Pseudopithomyces chartarum TaxID=1892770 RepID=A0AAN6M4D7_9PLEO|nr:hypothetical protein GRF29_19g176455 [Pseudopithomyces chartarum]
MSFGDDFNEQEYDLFAYERDPMSAIDPQLENPQLGDPQQGHPQSEHMQLGYPQLGHPQLGHPQLEHSQFGQSQIEPRPSVSHPIDPRVSEGGNNPPVQNNEVSIREILEYIHTKSPATRYVTWENCGLIIDDFDSGIETDFPKRILVGQVDDTHNAWMYMNKKGQQRCESIPINENEAGGRTLIMGRHKRDLDQVRLDASVAHLKERGHNYSQVQRFLQLCLLLACEHLETIRVRRKDFDFEPNSEPHRYLESAIRRHCIKLDLKPSKEDFTHTRPKRRESTALVPVADRDRPVNTNTPFGYTNDPPGYTNDPARYANNNDTRWFRQLTPDQLHYQKREIEHLMSTQSEDIERRRRVWNQARETVEHQKEELDDILFDYNEAVEREDLAVKDFNMAMDAQMAQRERIKLIDQILNGG